MEKNRIYHAAFGCVIIIVILAVSSLAQDDDHGLQETLLSSDEDTSDVILEKAEPDTIAVLGDSLNSHLPDSLDIFADSAAVLLGADTLIELTHTETLNPTAYYRRTFLAKAIADELKSHSTLFIQSPGPVGSAQIPVRYLNTPGVEIAINGHPFIYNDIYRPYRIGADLNAVPWEILNEAYWGSSYSLDNRIHLDLGRPPDNENRSDVEVFRGPYEYNASRWRFFRPFNRETYGYFTAGFKKSDGYLSNTGYDAFHVTGGLWREIYDGILEINVWKYRAKGGLSSFDFLTPQFQQNSRTTRRTEISYSKKLASLFDLKLSGMYQKNGQIISDLSNTLSIDNDIGGGTVFLCDSLKSAAVDLGIRYYRIRTYKLVGVKPAVNIFEYVGKTSGKTGRINYEGNITYSWNGVDQGALLPSGLIGYDINDRYETFVSFARSRRLPDLNLLYFNDNIGGLGFPGFLEAYRFESDNKLKSPVTSNLSTGIEARTGFVTSKIEASYFSIENQIYLSYQSDTLFTHTVAPVNYDDEYFELSASAQAEYRFFDSEFGVSYRKWKERFFADNLEKGPAAILFGRISASRSFFFDDLFLGGTIEIKNASRQDYRSIKVGLTDGFAVLYGGFEFRYKDFIFWWNDDNLLNSQYSTWWPYPETPRTVWWGFRWRFYD